MVSGGYFARQKRRGDAATCLVHRGFGRLIVSRRFSAVLSVMWTHGGRGIPPRTRRAVERNLDAHLVSNLDDRAWSVASVDLHPLIRSHTTHGPGGTTKSCRAVLRAGFRRPSFDLLPASPVRHRGVALQEGCNDSRGMSRRLPQLSQSCLVGCVTGGSEISEELALTRWLESTAPDHSTLATSRRHTWPEPTSHPTPDRRSRWAASVQRSRVTSRPSMAPKATRPSGER